MAGDGGTDRLASFISILTVLLLLMLLLVLLVLFLAELPDIYVVDLDLTLDLVLSLSSSKDGSLLGPLLPLNRLWKD